MDAGGTLPPAGPAVYPYDKCNWGMPVYTKLAPSTKPPGGLALDNVPIFVSFGFDDNAHEDGMQWFLDFIECIASPPPVLGAWGKPCRRRARWFPRGSCC
jgi:hypothetical protein